MQNLERIVGKDVRINRESKQFRSEEMRTVTGTVVGIRDFFLRKEKGEERICYRRMEVDWGLGRIWTEDPESLELDK